MRVIKKVLSFLSNVIHGMTDYAQDNNPRPYMTYHTVTGCDLLSNQNVVPTFVHAGQFVFEDGEFVDFAEFFKHGTKIGFF